MLATSQPCRSNENEIARHFTRHRSCHHPLKQPALLSAFLSFRSFFRCSNDIISDDYEVDSAFSPGNLCQTHDQETGWIERIGLTPIGNPTSRCAMRRSSGPLFSLLIEKQIAKDVVLKIQSCSGLEIEHNRDIRSIAIRPILRGPCKPLNFHDSHAIFSFLTAFEHVHPIIYRVSFAL